MVDKYFNGTLPLGKKATTYDEELKTLAQATVSKVEEYMEKLLFSDALTEIWNLIRRANKYIDETQPWVLAKDEDKKTNWLMYYIT